MMKLVPVFLMIQLIVSCATAEESVFVASTPAAPLIRSFLQIPQSDSIDFIRWKLKLVDNKFTIDCNYGIGKNKQAGLSMVVSMFP